MATGAYPWTCPSCNFNSQDFTKVIEGSTIETSAEDAQKRTRKCLVVFQWNANGLSTKAPELSLRLGHENIDVVGVEETKLQLSRKQLE